MIAAGETGPAALRSRQLSAGLAARAGLIFPGASSPDKGGASSAIGDIGSHWCDLVQYVTGLRIVEVLADLTTVINGAEQACRLNRSLRRADGPSEGRTPVTIQSDEPGHLYSSASTTARAARSPSDRCARGTRTISGSRSTRSAQPSLRWYQERQNELWVGHRHAPNWCAAPRILPCSRRQHGLYAHPARWTSGGLEQTPSGMSCTTSTPSFRDDGRPAPVPCLRSPRSMTAIAVR